MLGGGLQFNQNRKGDDRFYIPAKARRNYHQNPNNPQIQRTQSDIVNGGLGVGTLCRDKYVLSGSRVTETWTEQTPKPEAAPPAFLPLPLSNIERFLESITPSVNVQYLSKTSVRSWRTTCDVEYQPYFMLSDLWDSFKEWSAYGAGVPLVLNGSDSVVQYYVPYLSGIQIYIKARCTNEDSDGDCDSRDTSSDGSSDSDRDRALAQSRGQQNRHSHPSDVSLKMDRLFLRDQSTTLQEGFSSDEGESRNPEGFLLFEYYEHDPPFCREPLADKVSDLAVRFPELKSMRSCDVLAKSWLSVAWYPIYRIPMGPTLKDLDASFLTYHSLSTLMGGVSAAQAPVVIYPSEIDGNPRISLPSFGLAFYKYKASLWTSDSGSDSQLVSSLTQAADSWLRLLQVAHPDHQFFSRGR